MAEVIGTVASVLQIVGLARTCIDLYGIIDDSKNAAKDLRRLVSQLKEQRVRFFLWCDYVGMSKAVHLQARAAAGSLYLEPDTLAKLTPKLRGHFVRETIFTTLQQVEESFKDSRELLDRYTSRRSGSTVSTLVEMTSRNYLWFGIAEYISNNEPGPSKSHGNSLKVLSLANMGWIGIDKKKLTQLVNNLQASNDALESILDRLEKIQLQRREQLLATTTPFAGVVAMAQSIQSTRQINSSPSSSFLQSTDDNISILIGQDQDTRQLVEIYRYGYAIDQDLAEETNESSIVPETVPPAPSLFADENHLLASEFVLPDATEQSVQHRLHTYYKSHPVIVEWKYYSASISPDLLTLLKKRVSMLASQLQRSSQTSGFCTLGCVGYFDNAAMHRIGIVFEYPDSDISSEVLSLRERMAQDRHDRNVRDLTSRFAVAKALVMAVYCLHSVGWLHKSIRADNILFFESPGSDSHSLSAPFVCGFDFSRRDSPLEMTEDVSTILLSHYADRERALYRHPELDLRAPVLPSRDEDQEIFNAQVLEAESAAASFRFRKAYDVYSLGIILLEIGLWRPVKDLSSRKEPIEAFRQRIRKTLLPELRYRAGKIYFDIVRRCIEGDLGQDDIARGPVVEADNTEIEALRESRVWLAAFDRNVVSELEKCNV